jgi:hypothetical protein
MKFSQKIEHVSCKKLSKPVQRMLYNFEKQIHTFSFYMINWTHSPLCGW